MAEIDKSLPNVKQTINVPSQEEVEIAQQEKLVEQQDAGQPVEQIENEDGSIDINFDPNAVSPGEDGGHFANLAELLPDNILDPLGSKLYQDFTDYKTSRKEWEHSYIKGLDLLGFTYEEPTEPFKGASGATHPVLAEAVTQFQALAVADYGGGTQAAVPAVRHPRPRRTVAPGRTSRCHRARETMGAIDTGRIRLPQAHVDYAASVRRVPDQQESGTLCRARDRCR